VVISWKKTLQDKVVTTLWAIKNMPLFSLKLPYFLVNLYTFRMSFVIEHCAIVTFISTVFSVTVAVFHIRPLL